MERLVRARAAEEVVDKEGRHTREYVHEGPGKAWPEREETGRGGRDTAVTKEGPLP